MRAPFLRHVETLGEIDPHHFPFTIPAFHQGISLEFDQPVTFLVGENGSGKSTLLEALAFHCGFNVEGGSRNHSYANRREEPPLAKWIRLSWFPKATRGFFLRAESFFNFASYIDEIGGFDAYGGKSLHDQSHGESFLAVFESQFANGIYLLDEPEASLSPRRQLSLIKLMHDHVTSGRAQFVIATHSPVLLAYPGATVLSLDGERIVSVPYNETDHYELTRRFLNAPERYLRHLLSSGDDEN